MESVFTIDMCKVAESIVDEQGKPVCYYDGGAPCVKSLFLSGVQLLVGTATGNCMNSILALKTHGREIGDHHPRSRQRDRCIDEDSQR